MRNAHREAMISALERYLIKNWMVNVTGADLPGSSRPGMVNGRFPDLEGITPVRGQRVFGAAEECDTYATKDSRERLDAFSRVRNAAVFLVIPAECYGPARVYVQTVLPRRNIIVMPYGEDINQLLMR